CRPEIQDQTAVYSRPGPQPETQNIWARGDDDVLLTGVLECDGRGLHSDVGGKLPERFAGALIDGREAAVRLSVEHKASCRGEDPGPGLGAGGTGLRNFPRDFSSLNIDRTQESLAGLIGISGRFSGAFLERHEVVEPGVG